MGVHHLTWRILAAATPAPGPSIPGRPPGSPSGLGSFSGFWSFVLFVVIPIVLVFVAISLMSRSHRKKFGDALQQLSQVGIGLFVLGLALGGAVGVAVWLASLAS